MDTTRHRTGHVIRTADALAEKLAELARAIRGAAHTMIRRESERGRFRRLYRAFQAALIHDLTEEDFADAYAQIIICSLLTAAISRTDMGEGCGGTALATGDIADIVPITNPFLKEMLQTFLKPGGRKGGIDFDRLGIQEVVDLLCDGDQTDLRAVLHDFGDRTHGEDPIIHFYEHFLAAYDKRLKIRRGVFYTPQPVVSYIIRSIHELLRTEFGLEDGLADTTTWQDLVARERSRNPQSTIHIPEGVAPDSPFVQILDPATGTATFLVEVVEVIYCTLTDKWKKQGLNEAERRGAWNGYVPKHLLPRLYGYELMMAPYATAHMKLPLKLKETGFTAWSELGGHDRVRIYLTNALEPPGDERKRMEFAEWAPALAHEASAVDEIKRHKRFTVIVGNPPYAGISSNMTESSQRLIDAYKIVDGGALNERKLWLQDDYVKFIRQAQMTIESAGLGLLGYITNHGYLDNPTFRGMRQSLTGAFTRLRLLDLHGNANKREQAPGGSEDRNLFDIRQGVAICLATRGDTDIAVGHAELWGTRETKNAWLTTHNVRDTEFTPLAPESPYYFFVPQNSPNDPTYEAAIPVDRIFPLSNSGIVTARDGFVLDLDLPALRERIAEFRNPERSDTEIRTRFDLSENYMWRLSEARKQLMAVENCEPFYTGILYRPFNTRHIFFHPAVVWRPRLDVMRQLQRKNLALITTRQTRDLFGVLATRLIVGHKSVAAYDINSVFPLYVYLESREQPGLLSMSERVPNFAPGFLKALAAALRLPQEGAAGLPADLTPEDIFHYAYAVFHSPLYRNRYAESLKKDFPRLPLTGALELFRTLARLGGELVGLHLVEFALKGEENAPAEWPRYTRLARFTGSDRTIGKFPSADKAWRDGRVAINAGSGFDGIPEEVWRFHIGGYQVCYRWLSDRRERSNFKGLKGRTLSDEEILHYCRIVTALDETIRLMRRIDEAIDRHGGWPSAFSLRWL